MNPGGSTSLSVITELGSRALSGLFHFRLQWVAGWVLVPLLVGACAAPTPWLRETAKMSQAGEEFRRESGRRPGEIVLPASVHQPTVVPIELGDPIPFHFVPLPATVAPAEALEAPTAPPERRVTAVAVDSERLVQFLRTRYNIGVVDVRAVNGRFTGEENLLRVEFIPRARDEETALRDFLFVCAAALGMDPGRTVDRIVGLAVDLQLLPWLRLSTAVEDFERYRAGELTFDEYREKVERQRL
ncbi:MAG: hypothetical protein KatS3mg115_1606 [Candidatus Poribacteria bacterium]|nr:MAG: hypothetical protein KatS3mg115_1606 [Candidatus Poribacteria bacterium]